MLSVSVLFYNVILLTPHHYLECYVRNHLSLVFFFIFHDETVTVENTWLNIWSEIEKSNHYHSSNVKTLNTWAWCWYLSNFENGNPTNQITKYTVSNGIRYTKTYKPSVKVFIFSYLLHYSTNLVWLELY